MSQNRRADATGFSGVGSVGAFAASARPG